MNDREREPQQQGANPPSPTVDQQGKKRTAKPDIGALEAAS